MLIAIRDESPLVCRAPNVSEPSNFGRCHIGTSTIRDCTISSYYVQAVRTESRQFGSKSLLFTPFGGVLVEFQGGIFVDKISNFPYIYDVSKMNPFIYRKRTFCVMLALFIYV